MNDKFELRKNGVGVSLDTENGRLYISKSVDDDIWFSVSKGSLEINISDWSRNIVERKVYFIFESLMKSIIGRYILSGDYKSEYNGLPDDFIDLDKKTIVWHSDSEADNILWLEYGESGIKVFIFGNEKDKVLIRIRTSGSNYGYYYQEFEEFYRRLCEIAFKLEKIEKAVLVKKI